MYIYNKSHSVSGFVCNSASLVGVDGFECRAVAFATARHHRGSAAVAERGAEIHDRGNRPKSLNPSTPNRRQAKACFFDYMSSGSLLT